MQVLSLTACLACLASFLLLACSPARARQGFGDGGQEYGFVNVREGAHMFYWLYYAKGGNSAADLPLVIWLQGGPGSSSSGYGNFVEVGPLDYKKNKRDTSWADHVNLLLIDNPVGTGFSYVDSYSRLVTNNKQIADDLVVFMKKFLEMFPVFKTLPLFIFCESYGGKMVSQFALSLEKEKAEGNIAVNLKAIALGDSWISPMDSVLAYAPYLYHTSLVDTAGYKKLTAMAQRVQREVDAGRYFQATRVWTRMLDEMTQMAGALDVYNIITKEPVQQAGEALGRRRRGFMSNLMTTEEPTDSQLDEFINKEVKPALNLTNYAYQTTRGSVYNALWQDIMTPVTEVVEELLSTTDVNVIIYTGQLDLIIPTPGTLAWVNKLKWNHIDSWKNAPRETLQINGVIQGFVKKYEKLSFYWVLRSGHMIPLDNPQAGLAIVREVTKYDV